LRSIRFEINGNIFPIVLAAVSMSGRVEEMPMTTALVMLKGIPAGVRMRR
jgi:hypothetical protein